MRLWIIGASLLALAACSKVGNFERKQMEFRQECFGDHSVKCRSMLMDLNMAKMEAAIELVEKHREELIACRGQEFYEGGIHLIKEKIAYFDDARPNLFMRTVMSGAEVELDLPTFKLERDLVAFQAGAGQCMGGRSRSGAVVEQGSVNANSTAGPAVFETLAGRLGKTQSAEGQSSVTLNGAALFHGEDAQWQSPLRKFKLSDGRDVILMASTGGRGTSCETLFFFLTVNASGATPSPEFGTCSPQLSFQQANDRITMTIPKTGGSVTYVFNGVSVMEDGQPVTLQDSNDPSK